jgi:integrase
MSVYKRGSTYSYDFFLSGRRHTGNTGATSKAKANEYVVDMKRRLREEQETGIKDISIEDALNLQLSSTSKAATSLTTYATRIKRLIGKIEGHWGFDPTKLLSTLTTVDVETLKVRRVAEGMSPSTVAVEVGQLKAAYNLAKSLGYRVDQRTTFKRPRFKPKMRALSLEEEAKLVEAMLPTNRIQRLPWGSLELAPIHVRVGMWDLYDLTVFLLDTGCRHNEAVKCRWTDVSLNFDTLDVRRWKTGNESIIYPTRRLKDVLRRRYKERKTDALFVFPAASDPTSPRPYRVTGISDTMEWLGLNQNGNEQRFGRATVHSLRHTYASKLLRSRKYDLAGVRDRLGQSSIKSTEIYAHLDQNEEAKRATDILDELTAG